jgi:F0F1-type ATP synthase assembly protein I
MQQNMFQSWASQLVAQSPVQVALLVMLVLALVLWGRYPRACLLAFLGSLLLLLTSIVFPLVGAYVIQGRPIAGSGATIGEVLAALGLVANVVRAVGYGLLTAAIFAGRTRPSVSGFPVTAHPPPLHGAGGPGYR